MIVDLIELCATKKWPEVRKYLSSDAAEEEKKSNMMYRGNYGITCLQAACYRGAPDDIIKAMLDIGGKELIIMTDGDDCTVLHYACNNGASHNIIKMLIEVGGKDLVMAKSNGGDTALHYLCWRIKIHTKVAEKINLILQVGDANLLLSAKHHAGQTPLEIATDKGASKEIKKLLTVQSTTPIADIMKVDLIELCNDKKWSELRKYISSETAEEEKKSNVMCCNGDGWTCLHLACFRGAPDDIIKTMIDIGGKELVMKEAINNRTALHWACIKGASHNIIKMLINVGGKDLVMANAGKGCDATALHFLCLFIKSHTKAAEKIKLFLQVGDANLLLSAKNHAGQTPLEIATDKGVSKKIKRRLTLLSATLPVADRIMQMEATHAQELLGIELFRLCDDKKWPEVRKYLSSDAAEEEKNSNIMYGNDDGITCLQASFAHRAPDDIIKTLLEIGGKESAMMIDSNDCTALHWACIRGASHNIIKMLINVGGKDLIMAKNKNGDTALHYLCLFIKSYTKAVEKIKLFLQVGDANLLLSAKNDAGQTPLEIATDKGASKEIKKLLTVQSTTPIADIMKVDLIELCINKDWPELRKYLSSDAAEEEKKSNVMCCNHNGQTCLHLAYFLGAPDDIIKTMIDIGGKELVMKEDVTNQTALNLACILGASYNIIKMLIEVGGKDLVMAKNKKGDTALHYLCLFIKSHTKVAEKIKLVLQIGDANLLLSMKGNDGQTPLEIATDQGASKRIKRRLTLQSATLLVADRIMQMEATHAQELLGKFDDLTLQSTTPVAEAAHAQELLGKFVEIFQNAPDDAKRRDIFLRAVSLTGTDVSKNNDSPFDDGDQSKIILDLPHFSKYNWFEKVNNCIGAHNATKLFTANLSSHPLLRLIQSGDIDAVEKQVLESEFGSKERTRLLEGRDNPFRCPALLLMARAENGMGNGNTVNIVRVLLQYGARPDARDICGNNVLHYLAKNVDSSDSIPIADDCINAARCSRYFGRKVMVNGTTQNYINSQVGTLQGYVHDQKCAETGRFAVVMDNDNMTLCFKPGNIFVMKSKRKVGACIYDESRKLFNEPNRLGEICIQDSLMNFSTKRGNKFALHMMDVHNIDLNGPQFFGDSAQQMIAASIAAHPGDETFRTKIEDYLAWKDHEATRFCVNCGEINVEYRCVRCQKVCYCSESCHIAHFSVHKKQCISGSEDEVVIQEFPFEASLVERCWFEEIFWLKVTSEKSNVIFKDRNASIRLSIDKKVFSGYRDLLKEASRGGTHVKATFRNYPKPKIIVFPKTKHKRKW